MKLNELFGKKESGIPQAMNLLDFIAPPAIKVASDHFQIGEKYAKSYFIFSYPRYLNTGWLAPIINMDIPLDISLFFHPIDTGLILKKLRKKVTEVQSEIIEKEEDQIEYVEDRKGHDLRYAIDFSKAKAELGWEPQIEFEKGLATTIEWYKNNPEWWRKIKSGEYQDYYEK